MNPETISFLEKVVGVVVVMTLIYCIFFKDGENNEKN